MGQGAIYSERNRDFCEIAHLSNPCAFFLLARSALRSKDPSTLHLWIERQPPHHPTHKSATIYFLPTNVSIEVCPSFGGHAYPLLLNLPLTPIQSYQLIGIRT